MNETRLHLTDAQRIKIIIYLVNLPTTFTRLLLHLKDKDVLENQVQIPYTLVFEAFCRLPLTYFSSLIFTCIICSSQTRLFYHLQMVRCFCSSSFSLKCSASLLYSHLTTPKHFKAQLNDHLCFYQVFFPEPLCQNQSLFTFP